LSDTLDLESLTVKVKRVTRLLPEVLALTVNVPPARVTLQLLPSSVMYFELGRLTSLDQDAL
jgi:hypothetical protein